MSSNTRKKRGPRRSRQSLRERREAMARRVAADGTRGAVSRVARHFRVTVRTVRDACHEFGVLPPGNEPSNQTLDVIAALQSGEGQSSVARSFGLTRQRVNRIKTRAEEAGIVIPRTEA